MEQVYDVIIVITPKDYKRVRANFDRLIRLMPADKIIFVGSKEVGELAMKESWADKVGFVDENDILPFDSVNEVMKDILKVDNVPRGLTGWYYQQFLKMKYCDFSAHDYYLTWDGDTVPTKPFFMFEKEGDKPYFDLKHEYHEEYFVTIKKLLGMEKVIGKSFISEHMLFNVPVMKNLIGDIENNVQIPGTAFFEKILRAVDPSKIQSNSFSEFETYGTYTAYKYTSLYKLKEWHSIRYGAMYFIPEEMTEEDYAWLGHDFDAISFEKDEEYLPDFAALFSNPEYREKLTPRQIVEAIQEFALEGLEEKWDE